MSATFDASPEQLRTFVAVIEEGTLEAAARELSVTPSAVSQRIKALEQSLGRALLRRGKPARPTESGAVVLQLARQLHLVTADAMAQLTGGGEMVPVSLVVNADSLATWAMPALAAAARAGVILEVTRDDQDHSTASLRDGSVMAVVSSDSTPQPGCTVHRLGTMVYRPMATPEYVQRWLPDGPTADALSRAPLVVFDRRDDLQAAWLRRRTRRRLNPPQHVIPESVSYRNAVAAGLGWGMIPTLQVIEPLVPLAEDADLSVRLYWHQWKLQSASLQLVATEFATAAAEHLS